MVTRTSLLTFLERFFLRRALRRSVRECEQSKLVRDIAREIINYWEQAFPEDNQPTLEYHLRKCVDEALGAERPAPSHRDVVVYCGHDRYELSQRDELQLRCSKVSGWTLWRLWDGNAVMVGGELDMKPIRVEVAGALIVDNNQFRKAA